MSDDKTTIICNNMVKYTCQTKHFGMSDKTFGVIYVENKKKDKRITVRLSPALIKSLESYCTVCNVTKSEAIRTILESMLKCY